MEDNKKFELNDEALDSVAGGAAPEAEWTTALCRLTDGHVCPRCGHDVFRAYKMETTWQIVCHNCQILDHSRWPNTEELDAISRNWMT